MSQQLVKLDQATRMLAEARSLDEIKEIIDIAEAATVWAKAARQGYEAQNYAAEIKLKAERRAGEFLSKIARGAPGRPEKGATAGTISAYMTALDESGTSTQQASRWQRISTLTDDEFCSWVAEETKARRDLTTAGLLRQVIRKEHESLKKVQIDPPKGRYSCIVVDPPWEMQLIGRDVRKNQVDMPYPSMSYDELRGLSIPSANNAHLYLWTTHKHLPAAFEIAEAWSFKYQCLMTWVKNVGFTPYSWMYSTEHVLFCRRGNLPLLKQGMRLDFSAKVREHSRKPDEFYGLVREASPGPRIDMFSREKRVGFEQWGNEPEKFVA